MIGALFTLLALQLAGEFIVRITGIPVPGPVIGMLLLVFGLAQCGRVPKALHGVAETLLGNFSLLFVPAGVGVLLHVERIAHEWLAILAALVLSTLITIAATALAMRAVLRRRPPREPSDG
ncbi:putative effector of murein hydrolase LrgA (UPF0299 family) [Plasticicumulans lactativorans]|uniref:Putative effector of murein hydrolase LrgA (UPF0299 family) n=1 Tax=Plasticicumulans lactativorans TaxID=1133106 RepID=A0A4R2L6A5_9GAMM|nr:CidA/LrgA family protein [Plasticicumulans lactativorans]TCO80807.1 putative effector of murein hydrolase LrgA (UPF0299 family) [Plasticicumulans lactativorans]